MDIEEITRKIKPIPAINKRLLMARTLSNRSFEFAHCHNGSENLYSGEATANRRIAATIIPPIITAHQSSVNLEKKFFFAEVT